MTKTGTLLTLILFCATFLILKGQSGDAIGYIVTFDDDTLRGSLKHESEKASPRELIFFADGSASAIIYDPKTIKAFGYENNIFISADIDREISPTKLNELSDSPQLFYVKDTVFLQVIISGEKELLSFVDENGKENFYIKDDDKYVWLVHKKYRITTNEASATAYNNNYIGQLIIYLKGCPEMNRILSSTDYELESLVKSFNYYYGCISTNTSYEKEEDRFKFELSPLLGISLCKIGFSGTGNYYLTEVNYPWSLNLSGGVSANFFFPRHLGLWSFNNEVIYSSFLTNGTYTNQINSTNYSNTETQIGTSSMKINTMFRGHLPINYSTLFMDIGISNGFVISKTNNYKRTTYINGESNVTESSALESLNNYNIGFIIGFGIKINRVSGFLRYELGSEISNDNDPDNKINSFYLMLSYKLL
jgi:hypothetical protein